MSDKVDDLCVKPHRVPELVTRPIAAPIFPATVFACDSPAQASQLLAGQTEGFASPWESKMEPFAFPWAANRSLEFCSRWTMQFRRLSRE